MSTPMSTIKRKRPINGSSNPNPKTPRPIVATTRASLARANATKTPAKTAFGRRAEPTEPKQLPPKQNANQVAAELKKRPGWDLRGKVSDMQKLIDLNHEQLLELERSRKDLEVTVDEKVSEAKEILEREAGLKAEIQTMERQHAQQIEDLKNQQRIRSQELQDNELIHKRQITNLEIEANDHQRQLDLLQNQLNARFKENEAFKSSIATMTNTFSQVEDKMRAMKLKLEVNHHIKHNEL
ncbi:hypothetical protein CLU79DRAFT_278140 [Phycomyces nitens]|nr:hypothetical protein CLU79DRAFT_278140 [Phycomyces nitens]